jgi:hypothetical protein
MLRLSSSQTEPDYGRLAALLAMEGPSKSVLRLMCKFWTQHLLSNQIKIQVGSMAPAPYVPYKIWKVIQRYNASITAQIDPQKILSVSACARLDGKELHENVARSDS